MHILIKKSLKRWSGAYRDPRYVIAGLLGFAILLLASMQAIRTRQQLHPVELSLFSSINNWPAWLLAPFYSVTQFGALSASIMWGAIGTYVRNIRAGLVVGLAGLLGWLVAKPLKLLIGRERPDTLLDTAQLLSNEQFVGLGFPSGHATVSAACITALYYYIDKRYRKYFILLVILVGISRIYLGGHLPADIIGGWALGVLVGSIVSIVFGIQRKKVSMPMLKKKLADIGIDAVSARTLNVDARGSIPVMVEDSAGRQYFAKLFGKQEHAADWLFKITRYFRFKSFTDEEPFLNSKRNVEHEAIASMWAARAGVRTPEIRGYAKVGPHWMLVQDAIDAKPLDKFTAKSLSDATLRRIWREVGKLQNAKIAHRDLRTANILVDDKGQPWIIDFGFAEVASVAVHRKMDIAELLMACTLQVGPARTIKAAQAALGKPAVQAAAPYVQMAVFSRATTTEARKNRSVYKKLRSELAALSGDETIEDANVQRLKPKYLLNAVLFGLFLYIVVPQFNTFKGAIASLAGIDFRWLAPVLIASFLSYISSAMAVVTLTSTPVSVRSAVLSQFASSFASKVLPGGIGPATIMVRFLRKSGLDDTAAASLLVVQRIIDFAMFIVPLSLVLLLRGNSVTELITFDVKPQIAAALAGAILLLLIIVFSVKRIREKVWRFIHKTREDFHEYASSPKELLLTALFSFGVTAAYVASLYFSLLAVGLHVSPIVVLVVYATATIAGSASPAPGGLGALEIAMAATLIGLGFNQPASYSAVILYRLATFWAPVPFGFIAYQYMQRRKLL